MFKFAINCIAAKGEDIVAMVEQSTRLTADEFIEAVGKEAFEHWERRLGYRSKGGRLYHDDLSLATDYAVTFHKSWYRGRLCVYFANSSVEYVFTGDGDEV